RLSIFDGLTPHEIDANKRHDAASYVSRWRSGAVPPAIPQNRAFVRAAEKSARRHRSRSDLRRPRSTSSSGNCSDAASSFDQPGWFSLWDCYAPGGCRLMANLSWRVRSPPSRGLASASMEKKSIIGGEVMGIADGSRGWPGRSNRVVRRRNRRRPEKPFESGRREHDEIVVLDIAGITQLVWDVAWGGETFAWPKRGDLVSDDHLQFSGKHIIGLVLTRMRMARHHHCRRETNLQEAVSSAGIGARQPYRADAHVKVIALGSRLTVDRI